MKTIYIDLDNTICNYTKGIGDYIKTATTELEKRYPQSRRGFFISLQPITGALTALKTLQAKYDVWILTRPSFKNIHSYSEKAIWVRDNLGYEMQKKLILCGDKSLLRGDILIDDMTTDGQDRFKGKFIHFGTEKYPDWQTVINELI